MGLNNNPVIGIIAQPYYEEEQYIAASYVKWIEASGGQVVPIPYNASDAYLDYLLLRLSGVLFPGGASNKSKSIERIYQQVLVMNWNGVHFPIWGTCQGMEWLVEMTSRDDGILERDFDAYNVSLPIHLVQKGRLFKDASADLMNMFTKDNVMLHNHHQGISSVQFRRNSYLNEFYRILSTNVDKANREFVSSMEGNYFPFYGVQYHPEKNNFEFGKYTNGIPYESINHAREGILTSQYLSNFFIQECRKNIQHKSSLSDKLIYHYTPNTNLSPEFVQIYTFSSHDYQRFQTICSSI